ncbi:MAG: hypothetical protein NC935_02225 [Candidatus Omnitrophica bacterium]|nr:hypothetical protein [Candidatus Omnitrophota bacterium]
MQSLLIYLVETLKEKYKVFPFSYKELLNHFTHVFRIKEEQARELIRMMIKINLIIEGDKVERERFFNVNFDVEKELLLKWNERRLKEFKKTLGLL